MKQKTIDANVKTVKNQLRIENSDLLIVVQRVSLVPQGSLCKLKIKAR